MQHWMRQRCQGRSTKRIEAASQESRARARSVQSQACLRRAADATTTREHYRESACSSCANQSSTSAARKVVHPWPMALAQPIALRRWILSMRSTERRPSTYAIAASSDLRSWSGIATSFPSPLIDASVVRAVTRRTPVSAFSIVYSNVTLRDRASSSTVRTRIVSSYLAAA